MMLCLTCENGYVVNYYQHQQIVTRDMAIDSETPEMEGELIDLGFEECWEECPCCCGEYENCSNCQPQEENPEDA